MFTAATLALLLPYWKKLHLETKVVSKNFFFFFFFQPISKCSWCERRGSRQKTVWVRLRAVLQSAWWERFRWLHILNVSCSPSQNYSTFAIMQNAGTLIVCINANVYKREFFCVCGEEPRYKIASPLDAKDVHCIYIPIDVLHITLQERLWSGYQVQQAGKQMTGKMLS